MANRGEALLVSSHDMAMVAEVFPRVVILDGGTVVADGPKKAILDDEARLLAHGLERPCRRDPPTDQGRGPLGRTS